MSQAQGSAQAAPQAPSTPQAAQTPSQTAQPGAKAVPETGAKTPETKQEQAQRELYELIIDGNKASVDIEELKRGYQRAAAANKRFMEAARLREQAQAERVQIEAFQKQLQEDPSKVFMNNPKAREIAEKYLADQLRAEMMDPKERENLELKQQLEELMSEKERAKKTEEEKYLAAMTERFAADYETRIINILSKMDMPKNQITAKLVAQVMQEGVEAGVELGDEEIAELVREQLSTQVVPFLQGWKPEQFDKHYPDMAKSIRKYDLERLRAAQSKPKEEQKPSRADDDKPKKKMSREEWLKLVRKRAGV